MKQDADSPDFDVFIRPRKLKPFWIWLKFQFPSPPASVFFHSLLCDPHLWPFSALCVRKCLLVWSVTIYTFNKSLCGVVMGGWAGLWYREEMSATDRELRERREDKLILWNCRLLRSDTDSHEETLHMFVFYSKPQCCCAPVGECSISN